MGMMLLQSPGLTWKIGDDSVLSLTQEEGEKFTFEAKRAGTTTLQATAANGIRSETVTVAVEEKGAAQVYRISAGPAYAGQSATLSAKHVSGDTADSFTWKFTSPSGAVFTQTGSSSQTTYISRPAGRTQWRLPQ